MNNQWLNLKNQQLLQPNSSKLKKTIQAVINYKISSSNLNSVTFSKRKEIKSFDKSTEKQGQKYLKKLEKRI